MNKFKKILCVLVLSVLSVCVYAAEPFYFVQITDLHYGEPGMSERMNKIIDQINKLTFEVKAVIITGDITMEKILDINTVAQCKKDFAKLKPTVYYLPGNHDILARSPKTLEPTRQAFEKYFGPLAQKFEINGVVFMLMYCEPWADNFKVVDYNPAEWLRTQLQKADKKPTLLFMHRAPSVIFSGTSFRKMWKAESLSELSEMTANANVKGIIVGHIHKDELHYFENIPVYTSASVINYGNRQATYRIFKYEDGKLSYFTRYIE